MKRTVFGALLLVFGTAFAHDRGGPRPEEVYSHGRGGFELGICVGQSLAQQGVTLPQPAQGASYLNPNGDNALEETIRSAVQTCRSEFSQPPSPSPTPSSEPSTQPSQLPSVAAPVPSSS